MWNSHESKLHGYSEYLICVFYINPLDNGLNSPNTTMGVPSTKVSPILKLRGVYRMYKEMST